jgi:hypothetical protein
MTLLRLPASALLLLLTLAATAQPAPQPAPPAQIPPAQIPPEITSKPWLHEVVRHLYRWYIDERDIDAVVAADEVIFYVRELKPTLDEGDRSRFCEVVLPQFQVVVKAKQADYTIPELDTTVKNTSFRITSVTRLDEPPPKPDGAIEIRLNYTQLRDELFRTRALAAFPEGELLERLRAAARTELFKDPKNLPENPPNQPAGPLPQQTIFLAPLSPIANEVYIYWEDRRTLIRFASDIDLTNPAVWQHESLAVRLFPLEQKTVVSLDEVSGSNAFLTRDQAGRALFNCVVLGRKLLLQPPEKLGQ